MNKILPHTAGMLLVAAMCAWGAHSSAQVTTVTESASATVGTVTEFAPASETLVMKTETSTEPIRYSVNKETTIVDETGAPVAIEKVTSGLPISVRYVKTGDRLVASRIVVKRAAPVVEERTTTTQTREERPLTHEEKEHLKKERHEEKESLEKENKELRKADER